MGKDVSSLYSSVIESVSRLDKSASMALGEGGGGGVAAVCTREKSCRLYAGRAAQVVWTSDGEVEVRRWVIAGVGTKIVDKFYTTNNSSNLLLLCV